MVNILAVYKLILRWLMKLLGMQPQIVEIEPGTIINFWVPTKKSKKKPIVFLHGFAGDGIFTWQFQVLSLAKNYAVYVPDLLFFGGSITDKTERSPEFQAECLAKGLRRLGVEKCTLVGLSYGGMVGFKMAQFHPDLVESMVVTCSVMALTQSVSGAGLERIGFKSWSDCLLPESAMGVKAMLECATYKLPSVGNFIYKDLLELMFNNRKEKDELLKALVVNDKDFTIPHYPQSMHLLWGENDNIFNMKDAHNLKEQVGGKTTLHYIEKAGHLVQMERPFVYNNHLKKILALLFKDEEQKQ